MEEITSVNNQKIKEYAKLHLKKFRSESNYFIVEGKKAYDEIVAENVVIEQIFVLKSSITLINAFQDKAILVNDAVMKKLSSTDSVPEIVTVAVKSECKIDKVKKYNKIALFENIKDAGNLGTIIRSAAAFGIDAVVLTGDCIDVYSPKVIRAAAGNFFKVPLINNFKLNELKANFSDYKFISTDLKSFKTINTDDAKSIPKFVIMFGPEAEGLSKELLNIADFNLILEMTNKVESLNLAVSSSIIFYELSKTSSGR